MNKKICHISYHQPLDDRIYWKELLTLKEAGYEVVHLCVSDRNADYSTPEGIQIIEVQREKIVNATWTNRVVQLLFQKKGMLKTLLEKAAGVKADLYHYHDLQINAIAKELKLLPQAPKLIYDVHEVYWMLVKEPQGNKITHVVTAPLLSLAFKRWELKKAAFCDHIIATDEFTKNYFTKKLPRISCSLIYNYSFFNPDEIAAAINKKYHFIYTGLLSKGRGIREIVKAISLLARQYSYIKILLIGPFENEVFEKEIEKLIQKLNLQNHIELHSPVPFTEIADYYKLSKVGLGIFHRTPKYSTFIPIKLFEYMAFGLPVIFSDHGPSSQIIRASNSGVLVHPKKEMEIYGAMLTVLQNETLYKKFSQNGMAAVKQQYNWNTQKEKLLKLYQTLLS